MLNYQYLTAANGKAAGEISFEHLRDNQCRASVNEGDLFSAAPSPKEVLAKRAFEVVQLI
jgi:hypothetical protein